MKTNVDSKKYQIYNDIETKLHIAIKRDNVPHIEKIVDGFKGVENVPDTDEYLTLGIYLKNGEENEYNMISENENETKVKIKNLRFDNL